MVVISVEIMRNYRWNNNVISVYINNGLECVLKNIYIYVLNK